MLKLEKSRKDREIYIRFHHRENFWNRYLLLAFGTAIAIHLLAALLFHVRLFSSSQLDSVLPFTKTIAHDVKGSSDEKDSLVVSQVNMEGRVTPAQLKPVESKPQLPMLPLPHLEYFLEVATAQEDHFFKEIEDEGDKERDKILQISPWQLNVIGSLGEIPLIGFPKDLQSLFEPQPFSSKNLHQIRLVYHIYVDSVSGQICWFQQEIGELDRVGQEKVEKLLKNLTFQSDPHEFVRSGQLEIVINESIK